MRIFENTKVTGIRQAGGRVTGVDTADGAVRAEFVVNCAGLWAREVGRMAGVNVPLMAAEHFYVVTDASPDIPRNLPVLRVPDECAYVKEEAGKLLVGFFEPKGKPLPDHQIPDDSEFLNLPDDWDHLARELELASERLPILKRIGLHTFFNGPESFTPDGRWILGEAPSLRNFFVAAGFNSIGIQTAGGAGKAIAEWMEAGEPTFDLTAYDIRRCQPFHGNATYLADRIGEALGLHYADQFPYRSPESARGVRTTPLHERLSRARRLLRRGGRLGARRLVPARGRARTRREGRIPLQLGSAELVRIRGRGAQGGAQRRGPVRPFAVRQDPRRGPRCRGRPAAHLRQRHRRGAGPHRLYAMAQPQRRHRGRSDRRAPLRRRVPRGDVVGDACCAICTG